MTTWVTAAAVLRRYCSQSVNEVDDHMGYCCGGIETLLQSERKRGR